MDTKERKVVEFCVVYIWLVIMVMYANLIEIEGMVNKLNTITIYSYLLFCPIVYLLYIWLREKVQNLYQNNYIYYNTKIYNKMDITASLLKKNYFGFIVVCTFVVIVFISLFWNQIITSLYSVHMIIWNEKTQSNVIAVISIVYGLIVALMQILETYLDKKCYFFDSGELPVVRANKIRVIISLGSLACWILVLYFGNESLYICGLIEIIWLLDIALIIFSYLWQYLRPIAVEQKLINKIDKLYGTKKVYPMINKYWEKNNTLRMLGKLLEEYINVLGKIDISTIENISYGYVLVRNKDNLYMTKNIV